MTLSQLRSTVSTEPMCDNINTVSAPSLRELEQVNTLLKMMVAELLIKNQNLRWKLEDKLSRADSALATRP